jgi:hypothetical protein
MRAVSPKNTAIAFIKEAVAKMVREKAGGQRALPWAIP